MQTGIGGADTSVPTTTISSSSTTIANGNHLTPPTILPFASSPGGSQVSSGKAKALQLGANKVSNSVGTPVDSLATEWLEETEAEVGTTNAWDGDLMDVNADADDWSECIVKTEPIWTYFFRRCVRDSPHDLFQQQIPKFTKTWSY